MKSQAKSLKRFDGELLIDHRASPGTPAVPEGSRLEAATVTCSHCNSVVILNPLRTRPRNYCPKCDHYICDHPGCLAECRPFEKYLDTVLKGQG